MPDDNPLGERGRAIEDDYFRKRDRELIEKLRQASAAETARRELSEKSGLHDPQMIEDGAWEWVEGVREREERERESKRETEERDRERDIERG